MIAHSTIIAIQAWFVICSCFAIAFFIGRHTQKMKEKEQEKKKQIGKVLRMVSFRGKTFVITPEMEEILKWGLVHEREDEYPNEVRVRTKYYYIPYFFRRNADGSWEILDYAELPEKVQREYDEISKSL